MNDSQSQALAEVRPGEKTTRLPESYDAGIYFIGRVRTPWMERSSCPRQGDPEHGPVCTLEIDPHWAEALMGITAAAKLQVMYWMHQAPRNLLVQVPRAGSPHGTFALRSPARPNPIASTEVILIDVKGTHIRVRGLDCIDGTPIVDVKPVHPIGRHEAP